MYLVSTYARRFKPLLGVHYSTQEIAKTQQIVENAILKKKSVYVAGEPAENNDLSVFSTLSKLLLSNAKQSNPESLKEHRNFFKDINSEYKKYLSLKKTEAISKPHGALILGPSPDVGIQRYCLLRSFDKEKKLRLRRIVSSLEMYTLLTAEVLLKLT